MKRVVIVGVALCLAAAPALAASPKIEAAIKVFKAVATDQAKLKIYCDMSKAMESIGDKPNPAIEKQIEGYMKQLGPDFQTAWAAGDDIDENSPDGQALGAALDELSSKCT